MNHIEKYGVIVAAGKSWAVALYKYEYWCKGDTVFRTAIYAIATKNITLLKKCIELLKQRRRWPEEFDHDSDAQSYFEEYLNDLVVWYNRRASRTKWAPIIPWRIRYRYRKGMTRDPFVMVLSACEILEPALACELKIPWLILRPDLHNWRKYLVTGEIKYKLKYEFWAKVSVAINKNPRSFVTHLRCWKARIADSEEIMLLCAHMVPHWNHLCNILVGNPLNYLAISSMKNYRAKTGYQWTEAQFNIPPNNSTGYLDDEEPIKIDKDILDWAIQEYYEPN